MGSVMLDPCDLCPLFPQGHDVLPFPAACQSCYWLRFWELELPPQAVDHPQTQ